MNRCADCKHWHRATDEDESDDGKHRCEALSSAPGRDAEWARDAQAYPDCDGIGDHGDGDGSGRRGIWLMTAPTFGCALWEPIPLLVPVGDGIGARTGGTVVGFGDRPLGTYADGRLRGITYDGSESIASAIARGAALLRREQEERPVRNPLVEAIEEVIGMPSPGQADALNRAIGGSK